MASGPRLVGKVCLVTGATRGIGRGIALQLGQAGATVYITGRTLKKGPHDKGSLEDTAREVQDRGGKCIPVQCDHSKDEDIQKLFDRISSEQDGRLDILVNNAYSAVTAIFKAMKVPFWEQPTSMWDEVNNVGLRNHYICSVYAAKMMVPQRQGLIVNVSSPAGLTYLFNVAYGIGKAACDRMAGDCGHELRKHNVAYVSLWPGAVHTELVDDMLALPGNKSSAQKTFQDAESVEFAGKAATHLAADPNVMKKTGRILIVSDLASEYGFIDVDGKTPPHFRSIAHLLDIRGYRLAAFMPLWFKVPRWILALYGSKL